MYIMKVCLNSMKYHDNVLLINYKNLSLFTVIEETEQKINEVVY